MEERGNRQFFTVIPCYREAGRVAPFLGDFCEKIAASGLDVAVQVVDDGSGADDAALTARAVAALAGDYPFLREILLLPENRGKGGAIYAGWERAGDAGWLAFADADGATCASEILRLFRAVEEAERQGDGADAWLASRVKMLGRSVDRTLRRHVMGRVYATLASAATGLAVYDSQCGCKVFRAAMVRKVRPHLRDTRFGFDMELLAHLHREGAKMREFPVDWRDVPGSKVRLLRDSWRMFRSLWELRARLSVRAPE